MIVMKFGGTSVESAAAIERVAGIVKARLDRQPVVVVSAMGKTTNRLLAIAEKAYQGERDEAARLLEELASYTLQEARPVCADPDWAELAGFIETHFQELSAFLDELSGIGEFPPQYVDLVSSYGERLSSRIVAAAFRFFGMDGVHVDSREVIVTDRRHTQAAPLYSRSYAKLEERVRPLAQAGSVVVMGGFIGSTQDGFTTTLGRGGSDFSASIVGAGIGASEIQIWTDVDGMLTCDPRILPGGHRVKMISFAEAAELAYFGAKVLHPATVVPAIEKNIPVLILNSRNPDSEGTRIVAESVPCANAVKSIACKRNITVVNIQSMRMLMAHGFLKRIFDVFDRFETPVDMVSTSEVSVSLTIDTTAHLGEILAELRKIAEVSVDDTQSLICLVGDNIRETPGLAARVFGALRDVNIRMITQGASLLNLSVVVADSDLRRSVESLHTEFFSTLDEKVFEA
ncbi:MAG TPA: lysine-sensitive aspartokinase 3 [Bryobacteraceae bacterium]|nr:lysine-sensitive aspartokinase 3 [Bryobacteraceae bacterium]